MSPTSERPVAGTWRELALVAVALLAIVVIVLWEPITTYPTRTFLTADMLQIYPLFRLEPGYLPRNQVLSDPVVQFVPWFEFARDELAQGRFPLWNPLNGCGTPFWANFQSSVLSPFALFFYLLELKLALLLSSIVKIWLAGFVTYLFLRRLALRPVASWFGAASFMTCGFNMLLVAYPHPAVLIWLPGSLLCAEAVLQRARANGGALPRAWGAALFGSLVLMTYSGHPEILFFGSLTLAAYCAFRLIAWAWSDRRAPGGLRPALRTASGMVLIGLASILVAAPLLLPFAEYAPNSWHALAIKSSPKQALDSESWPRYLFPNFLGTIANRMNFGHGKPAPNYHLANLGYIGSLVMLFAALAIPAALRRASTALFALIALLWIPWAHDVLGFGKLLGALPGVSWIPNYVSQGPWLVSVAVLAAFTLDDLLSRERAPSRWRAAAAVVLVAVALGFALTSALELMESFSAASKTGWKIVSLAKRHVALMSGTLALGALAAAWAYTVRSPRQRAAAGVLVVLAFLVQNPIFWSHYQLTIEDRYVKPKPPPLARLVEEVGSKRTLMLSRVGIPPNVNLQYGIHMINGYDALGVIDYCLALYALVQPRTSWQLTWSADVRTLKLLGVEYVMIDSPGVSAPPTEPNGGPRAHWKGAPEDLEEVANLGASVLYRFPASRGRAWLAPNAHVAEDPRKAMRLAMTPNVDPYVTVFVGPELPEDFQARQLEKTALRKPDGKAKAAAKKKADAAKQAAAATDGTAPAQDGAAPGGEADAKPAEANGAAPKKAPRKKRAAAKPVVQRGTVETLRETPGRVAFRVEQRRPQYLVVAQPWYPGWHATIDGEPAPLLRANSAFLALDVPAGTHEVELTYRPASWIWGLRLAAAGLALALASVWFFGRGARKAS
jgi:hypothetical protein